MRLWKVGELARLTGVTVRTLHHYDSIGLLSPSSRSGSNYRMYVEEDIARLQQIVSLRQIGLSLQEISEYLSGPSASPLRILEQHHARLREQAEALQRLCDRIERLTERLRSSADLSADDLIQTVEMMTMMEQYYTREQLEELDARARTVGPDRIRAVEEEWAELMEAVGSEMERGTAPSDARVQALARRWQGLIEEFTGGNPGIRDSLQNVYDSETEVQGIQSSRIRALGEYVQKALASAGER